MDMNKAVAYNQIQIQIQYNLEKQQLIMVKLRSPGCYGTHGW